MGVLVIGLLGSPLASAGEISLANGSRLEGELATDLILVSTGTDLVEVMPDQVESLVPGEIRLRDGRVVRGTIIGGVLKVRTPLGEMGLKLEELARYTARPAPSPAETAAPPVPPAPPAPGVAASRPPAAPAPAAPAGPPRAEPVAPQAPPVRLAVAPTGNGARLRVVAPQATVHRDAFTRADVLGTVRRGEQLAYLDAIDRRLRLPLSDQVLDWGHWIKVKTATGLEGWVQADALEEVR